MDKNEGNFSGMQMKKVFGGKMTTNRWAWKLINYLAHLILTEKDKETCKSLDPSDTIYELVKMAEEEGFEIEIRIKKIGAANASNQQ